MTCNEARKRFLFLGLLGALADEPRTPAPSLPSQSAEACLCSRSGCVLSLWALSALFRKDRTELESVAESDFLAVRPREEDEAHWSEVGGVIPKHEVPPTGNVN